MERVSANAVTTYTLFLKYLTCNFSDLELARFKVIQSQGYDANRKLIGGLLSDLHCVQHSIYHSVRAVT